MDIPGPIRRTSPGSEHACALGHDGRALCWGSNDHFELGQATTAVFKEKHLPRSYSSRPLVVPGIEDAVDIAALDGRTCVIHDSGHISCRGRNERGQSGVGDGSPFVEPVRPWLPRSSNPTTPI